MLDFAYAKSLIDAGRWEIVGRVAIFCVKRLSRHNLVSNFTNYGSQLAMLIPIISKVLINILFHVLLTKTNDMYKGGVHYFYSTSDFSSLGVDYFIFILGGLHYEQHFTHCLLYWSSS